MMGRPSGVCVAIPLMPGPLGIAGRGPGPKEAPPGATAAGPEGEKRLLR